MIENFNPSSAAAAEALARGSNLNHEKINKKSDNHQTDPKKPNLSIKNINPSLAANMQGSMVTDVFLSKYESDDCEEECEDDCEEDIDIGDKEYGTGIDDIDDEDDDMSLKAQRLLEAVTSEEFNSAVNSFCEEHLELFVSSQPDGEFTSAAHSHLQHGIFLQYRKLVELQIKLGLKTGHDDNENNDDDDNDGCSADRLVCEVAEWIEGAEEGGMLFLELSEILSSVNYFEAFKEEMLTRALSKNKQDLHL